MNNLDKTAAQVSSPTIVHPSTVAQTYNASVPQPPNFTQAIHAIQPNSEIPSSIPATAIVTSAVNYAPPLSSAIPFHSIPPPAPLRFPGFEASEVPPHTVSSYPQMYNPQTISTPYQFSTEQAIKSGPPIACPSTVPFPTSGYHIPTIPTMTPGNQTATTSGYEVKMYPTSISSYFNPGISNGSDSSPAPVFMNASSNNPAISTLTPNSESMLYSYPKSLISC